MRKPTPNVEWQIVENEADWEHLQTPPTPVMYAAVSRRLRLRRYLWGGAALLLMIGVGGEWWRTPQVRAHQAEVESTAPPARGAVAQSGEPAAANLITHQTASDWQRQFAQDASGLRTAIGQNASAAQQEIAASTVEFAGELAAAHVVLYYEIGTA